MPAPQGFLQNALRNIVATSAVSHGVDVDRFNAMFFAGMPSDISEYIQASSRIGRRHPGFSCLIPVPQKRRDRYIVEVHDIFHRFLERMIAPAAIERWATNALKRVMPSIFQAWLNGFIEQREFVYAVNKASVRALSTTLDIRRLVKTVGQSVFWVEASAFTLQAAGVHGRGVTHYGQPSNVDFYKALLLNELSGVIDDLMNRADTASPMQDFWKTSVATLKPMTSLRDIDEGGLIVLSHYLPEHAGKGLAAAKPPEVPLIATKYVRRQRAAVSELDDEGDA